jgi:Glycosyl hydrolase family 26
MRAVVVGAVGAICLVAVASTSLATARSGPQRNVQSLRLGVYAGPGAKSVSGGAAFGSFSGAATSDLLDFPPSASWAGITGPKWLLSAHEGSPGRFEYSLPMLPDSGPYTLAACAAGSYSDEWRTLAQNLIKYNLASTIVRPGWEFNGTWYRWSAKSDVDGFVGCYRNIVTTMRSVSGQSFSFDWNPNLGGGAFPAERAYPGNAYVDYVGVDIYDTSWSHFATNATPTAVQQAAAWNDDLNGNHGLLFWSSFAASHGKPMAITEWGVNNVGGGHGGGDDPAFVNHMFDFMTDAANDVAYEHYFNTAAHQLTGATTFPGSAATFQARTSTTP